LLATKLSEFHTGYRAFSRQVLEALPLNENSDDFVFDNQLLAQAVAFGFRIGEVSCPTRYFPEASSINFRRSVVYGLGVLGTAFRYRLHRWGLIRCRLFEPKGRPGRTHQKSLKIQGFMRFFARYGDHLAAKQSKIPGKQAVF
jgi:hypothetical protein